MLEKCGKKGLEDGMKLLDLEDVRGIQTQHKGEILAIHMRRNITFSMRGEKVSLMGIDIHLKRELEH